MIDIKLDHKSKTVLLGIDNFDLKAHNGIRYALFKVGKLLRKTASDGILKSPKSGLYYKRNNRIYRSSAPGEYSKNVTGKHRRSIGFKATGSHSLVFGASEKHSKFLENGTVNMDARPSLLLAIKETEQEQKRILQTEMKRAFRS